MEGEMDRLGDGETERGIDGGREGERERGRILNMEEGDIEYGGDEEIE
jgi:hypothetical protein